MSEFSLNVGHEYTPEDPVLEDQDFFKEESMVEGTLPELNEETELLTEMETSMESLRQLTGLCARLEIQKGVNRDFAMEARSISPDLVLARDEYYTSHLSRTQYNQTLESLKDKIAGFGRRAWETLKKFWKAVVDKVKSWFSKNKPMTKAEAEKKVQEARTPPVPKSDYFSFDVRTGKSNDRGALSDSDIRLIKDYYSKNQAEVLARKPESYRIINYFNENKTLDTWVDKAGTLNSELGRYDESMKNGFQSLRDREDKKALGHFEDALVSIKNASELNREFFEVMSQAEKHDLPKSLDDLGELLKSVDDPSDKLFELYFSWSSPASKMGSTSIDYGPGKVDRDDIDEVITKKITEIGRTILSSVSQTIDSDLFVILVSPSIIVPESVISGKEETTSNESLEVGDYGQPMDGDQIEDLRDPIEIEADGLEYALENLQNNISKESLLEGFKATASNAWENLKRFLNWIWKKLVEAYKYVESVFKRLYERVRGKNDKLTQIKADENNLANPKSPFSPRYQSSVSSRIDLSKSLADSESESSDIHQHRLDQKTLDTFNTVLSTNHGVINKLTTGELFAPKLEPVESFLARVDKTKTLTEDLLNFIYSGSDDMGVLGRIVSDIGQEASSIDPHGKGVMPGKTKASETKTRPVGSIDEAVDLVMDLNTHDIYGMLESQSELVNQYSRAQKEWNVFVAKFRSAVNKTEPNLTVQSEVTGAISQLTGLLSGLSNEFVSINRTGLAQVNEIDTALDVVFKLNLLLLVKDDGTASMESYEDVLGNFGDQELIDNFSLEEGELPEDVEPATEPLRDPIEIESDGLATAIENLTSTISNESFADGFKRHAGNAWEALKKFMRWIWKKLTDGYKYVSNLIKRLLGKAKDEVKTLEEVQSNPNNLANPDNKLSPEETPVKVGKTPKMNLSYKLNEGKEDVAVGPTNHAGPKLPELSDKGLAAFNEIYKSSKALRYRGVYGDSLKQLKDNFSNLNIGSIKETMEKLLELIYSGSVDEKAISDFRFKSAVVGSSVDLAVRDEVTELVKYGNDWNRDIDSTSRAISYLRTHRDLSFNKSLDSDLKKLNDLWTTISKDRKEWNSFVGKFLSDMTKVDLTDEQESLLRHYVTSLQKTISTVSALYLNADKSLVSSINVINGYASDMTKLNRILIFNDDGTPSLESYRLPEDVEPAIESLNITANIRKMLSWLRDQLVKGYVYIKNQLKRALLYLTNLFAKRNRKDLKIIPKVTEELVVKLNDSIMNDPVRLAKYSVAIEAWFDGGLNKWSGQIDQSLLRVGEALNGPLALDEALKQSAINGTDIQRDIPGIIDLFSDLNAVVTDILDREPANRALYLKPFGSVKELEDFMGKLQSEEIHAIYQRLTQQIHAVSSLHDAVIQQVDAFSKDLGQVPGSNTLVQVANALGSVARNLAIYYTSLGKITMMLSNIVTFRSSFFYELTKVEKEVTFEE